MPYSVGTVTSFSTSSALRPLGRVRTSTHRLNRIGIGLDVEFVKEYIPATNSTAPSDHDYALAQRERHQRLDHRRFKVPATIRAIV